MVSLSTSLSVKLVLISTGVLSVAVAVVASAPAVAHFYLHQAPAIWYSLAVWLRPPYLYIVINFIIITIAASSRFHGSGGSHNPTQLEEESVEHHRPDQAAEEDDFGGGVVLPTLEVEEQGNICEDGGVALVGEENDGKEMVTWVAPVASSPERIYSTEMEHPDAVVSHSASPTAVEDKPLVSSRFGHRKPVRSSLEGGARALRVSRPKRQETLESTWKTITEGRAMPLTRHLKKSETFWENQNSNHNTNARRTDIDQAVRKSETFKDRTNQQLPATVDAAGSSPKLRKEPSLSQDELNRRVEAFIRKFNEEMRLQRQESLNSYKEMIGSSSSVNPV